MKRERLPSWNGPYRALRLLRQSTTGSVLTVTLTVLACAGEFDSPHQNPLEETPDASDRPPQVRPDASLQAVDAAPSPGRDAAPNPGPQSDCRDSYPEIPWTWQHGSECAKCYDCPAEGLLPGVAFITCKIDQHCYRFATVDNCNYDLCPSGSCALPAHDPAAYCRKDGVNYTYFVCRLDQQLRPFQTVNGTNYFQKSDVAGDPVYDVADTLPILGGCVD